MQIIGQLKYFDAIKPYLFTSHFDGWQAFFQSSIDWTAVLKGVAAFVIYAGGSPGVTWYLFRRKDVLV